MVASRTLALVSLASNRSAKVRSTLSSLALIRRALPISAAPRLAARKSAPPASTWNSKARARLARCRLAEVSTARLRLAPRRSAPLRLAPRSTARWKLAPCRFAPASFAPVRSRRFRLTPARLAPDRSAPRRMVREKLAPRRSAPARSAPERSRRSRFAALSTQPRQLLVVPARNAAASCAVARSAAEMIAKIIAKIIAKPVDRTPRSQLTISSRIDERQAITIAAADAQIGNLVWQQPAVANTRIPILGIAMASQTYEHLLLSLLEEWLDDHLGHLRHQENRFDRSILLPALREPPQLQAAPPQEVGSPLLDPDHSDAGIRPLRRMRRLQGRLSGDRIAA